MCSTTMSYFLYTRFLLVFIFFYMRQISHEYNVVLWNHIAFHFDLLFILENITMKLFQKCRDIELSLCYTKYVIKEFIKFEIRLEIFVCII